MPSQERVAEFIDAVVNGDHVEAITNFYHEHASMQENLSEPRQGRGALLTHERESLARIESMVTHPPHAVFINGDRVAIHWTFDAVVKNGARLRLNEISLQTWEGDRISKEQFFYDSATAWRPVEAEAG